MSYIYAIIIVVILSLIFILSYSLNSKIKVECDNNEQCEGCNVSNCYRKINKEE